nr:polyprotein [Sifaka hepacivirus]
MSFRSQTRKVTKKVPGPQPGPRSRSRRPLGRVVGGVYIVNSKKTREWGTQGTRRLGRDLRRGARECDQFMGHLCHALAPSPAWTYRDPRRRSRFLGHVIDGALGWAADVLHHVPVVGPAVGRPARWICGLVRAGEDGINWLTSPAGVVLFLLAILSFQPVGAAFSAPFRPITNCCSERQVQYCTELTCVHDSGCVICSVENNQTVCWLPSGPLVSRHPNYTGVDRTLADHIDIISAGLVACDYLYLGEWCGLAFLAGHYVANSLPQPVTLNVTGDCYMLETTSVAPGIVGWFDWLYREVQSGVAILDVFIKAPAALAHAFTRGHYLALASIAAMAMGGNPAKALALFLLYVEAAAAAPIPTEGPEFYTCSPHVPTVPCPEAFNQSWDTAWCYSFHHGRVYKPDFLRSNTSYRLLQEFFFWNKRAYAGVGCVFKRANHTECCELKSRPAVCGNCSTDCTAVNKLQTYELCGRTPFVTVVCWPPNGTTCIPRILAAWDTGHYPGLDGQISVFVGPNNRPVRIRYNMTLANELPPHRWGRLPFKPQSSKGSWIRVPKGFYSDYRDLSTGLITKDRSYQDYQVVYSASGTFGVPGISWHIVVIAVLAAVGARWTLACYAVLLSSGWVEAVPTTIYAATAASWSESVAVRAAIYLAICRWRHLGKFLSPSLVPFLALALADLVEAYTQYDVAAAVVAPWVVLALAGCLTCVGPRVALTASYLRMKFDAFLATFDRSVIFVFVLLFPGAVRWACTVAWTCYFLLILGTKLVVSATGSATREALIRAARRTQSAEHWISQLLLKVRVWIAGERGVFWFKHLDGPLPGKWRCSEPYYPFNTTVEEAEDVGYKLACGDQLRGLPVFCRAGTTVRAGISSLARGWRLTAPFSLRVTSHRGELKCLGLCITGRDTAAYSGSIVVLGSPMAQWMGFICNDKLYTVHHGAKGRPLAYDGAPRPPLMVCKETDLAVYDKPKGMSSLTPCACACTDGYLATRSGTLVKVCYINGKWVNTTPFSLREAKGCSGAPVICKCRGVKGMFTAARHARGAVCSIRMTAVNEPGGSAPLGSDPIVTFPHVPAAGADKRVQQLVAPTGSGKSTVLPHHYYSDGYTVLVLNPSVATTLSMQGYMREKYGVTPSIYTGDRTSKTSSRLSYSTYGMFAAGAVPEDYDVIICDECHATDATTLLGVGMALKKFESNKAKLLILATATPPGTPVSPHPNITEVQLDNTGEIPFHGKTLKIETYKRGRHLIFQATKNHCEELARDLTTHGIHAVYYYRGRDIGVIPPKGDVVVVATDALMTGYTGSFDSVTDCCCTVVPTFNVTMAPSFEVGVRTEQCDAIQRMQRRGRTGRGAPGVYYKVSSRSAPSGMVPTANLYEAYDSGLAWFGLTISEITTVLDFYKRQPITPAFEVSLDEVAAVFDAVGYVSPAYVETMKARAANFSYLHAAQYELAKSMNAMAPCDDPVWRGLNGTNKFPMLYRLGDYDEAKLECPELADRIASAFSEFFTAWPITLAGVGLVAAAIYVAADSFGHFVIKRTYDITTDTTSALHAPPPPISLEGALEECALPVIGELASSVGGFLENLVSAWRAAPTTDFTPHVLAAVQYCVGLLTTGDAPGLSCLLAGVGGYLSPLPLKTNLFLTCLGGAFAAKIGSARTAGAFTAAGALGACLTGLNLTSAFVSLFTVYSSSVSSCLVVLKLLSGQCPTLGEAAGALLGITSPGGAVMGAAVAVLIMYMTRGDAPQWMNRLLAMLNKGTSCDNYFVPTSTIRSTIISLLEQCNIWALFTKMAEWLNDPEETLCASPRSMWWEFVELVAKWLRVACELARACVARTLPSIGVPILQCQKPYKGPWVGTGIVRSRCSCGCEGVWMINEGKAVAVSVSKKCRAWWTGGIPINVHTVGGPRPVPTNWQTMIVSHGFSGYVQYHRKGDEVWMMAASAPDLTVTSKCPPITSAVCVDGAQTCRFAGSGWQHLGAFRVSMSTPTCVKSVKLPLKLSDYALKEPEERVTAANKDLFTVIAGACKATDLYWGKGPKLPDLDGGRANLAFEESSIEETRPAVRRRRRKAGGSLSGAPRVTSPLNPQASEFRPSGSAQPDPPSFLAVERAPDPPAEPPTAVPVAAVPKRASSVAGIMSLDGAVAPIQFGAPTSTAGSLPLLSTDGVSRADSSWLTMTSEEQCGLGLAQALSQSYYWAPGAIWKGVRRAFAEVATYTSGLTRNRNQVYVTQPEGINDRIKKVTITRSRTVTPQLQQVINDALESVSGMALPEWSWDEALAHTSNRTARSAVTGATAADLKAGGMAVAQTIYDDLHTTLEEPWTEVVILPKSEVFATYKGKETQKPTRIIAYPHLEVRVVEKKVLGVIGPAVAKRVCGDAYGFQYSPEQRVARLRAMWRSKTHPAGFACDTVCFDSTITSEDVDVECQLYSAAAQTNLTRLRIKTLHDKLYKGGPMKHAGAWVGTRNCRASGVFTTSSSNTITSYLKVKAAALAAGLLNPDFLICGDDAVVIFEHDANSQAKAACFAAQMKLMGAPQDKTPTVHTSLELITSCSSNVSSAATRGGVYHYMTRDPKIPLARCAAEGKRFNPLGTWLGYILANYPAMWVSRVLAVKFLAEFVAAPQETISFDWYGNDYSVSPRIIPYVIEHLHGRQCWEIESYTSRELNRVNDSLRLMGWKPLRYWKRVGRSVYAQCVRSGGVRKFLAQTLLSWIHKDKVRLDPKLVRTRGQLNYFDPYTPVVEDAQRDWSTNVMFALLAIGLLAVILRR